jgi:hypothetical protein
MHGLVLEGGVEAFDRVGCRGEAGDRLNHRLIAHARKGNHVGARRPHRRGTAARHGPCLAVGIDPALEQFLERRVD